MASLGAFIKLFSQPTSPAEFVDRPPSYLDEINLRALAEAERLKQDEAGPSFRTVDPMAEYEESQRVGAFNALQNIPNSPLGGAVALIPGAYEGLTRRVEGANPEVPNMLSAVDQMSLGGLVEGNVLGGVMRTKAPSLREGIPGGRPAPSTLGGLAQAEATPKAPRIEGIGQVVGTGKNGMVTVDDVAQHLHADTLKRLGEVTGEDHPAILTRALEQATKDVDYQMAQGRSGHDWYKADVQRLDGEIASVFPELETSPAHKTLFKTVVALLSPNTRPNDNLMRASRLWDTWRERGYDPENLPVKRPPELVKEGQAGQWGRGSEYALTKLQRLLTQEGSIEGAIGWLQSEHPVRELRKEGWGDLGHLGVNDNATGFEVFGPKVGQFVQNLEGNAKKLTVDKWFMRTWGRYMGTLVDTNGLLRETPLESQRPIMEDMADQVGKKYNMDPADVQATLWYYEQQLYQELGAKVKEVSFGESAETVRKEIERSRAERGGTQGSGGAAAGRGAASPGTGIGGLFEAAVARSRSEAPQGLTLRQLIGQPPPGGGLP